MAQQSVVEINVMQHLFYDLWMRNKALSAPEEKLLSKLVETYKAVIDYIAAKPNSFLIIESGWMLGHKKRATTKMPKELLAAWGSVRMHAVSKMGKNKVLFGDMLKKTGTFQLKDSLLKFAKGKDVKIIDCGEYSGSCPWIKTDRLLTLLKKAGIRAEHVASRPFGMTMPELNKLQRLLVLQNLSRGKYPFRGLPKPKALTMRMKTRRK